MGRQDLALVKDPEQDRVPVSDPELVTRRDLVPEVLRRGRLPVASGFLVGP
jgi:hypothetical protein